MNSAGIFATLVGLICNWSQERKSADEDKYKSFMIWLEVHHFEGLKERILASEDLQRDLHSLLHQELSTISDKLSVLSEALVSIGQKIDGFAQITVNMGISIEGLSTQACEILKLFADEHEARELIYYTATFVDGKGEVEFHYSPGFGGFTPDEPKFVESDLSELLKFGFMRISGHTSDGFPKFSLTRAGSRFAETLPPVRA